jgi:2-keto-4-pentenoate hydratase/2-oxohepta-3-ene-1,7-dioic acid hydratase in catechol pathway
MRFITFTLPGDATPRVGLLGAQDKVTDLTQAGGNAPFDTHDMLSLVAAGDKALAWVRSAAAAAKSTLDLAKLKLLAPIPRPRKNVFCVGWNYLEHFEEGAKNRAVQVEHPAHPVFFSKATNAVTGPFDAIPYDPAITQTLDWEAELGVVLSKGGKNITEAEGMNHIFGYMVINDVSAREIQRRHGGQWLRGKSLDGTCPMGPYLVTKDEVDHNNLRVICRLNGVVKQDSNTSYMFFKLPRILAELSQGLTLDSGDVISTGTPPGVGMGRTPPEYMKTGDVLETEIVGLGVMRNVIGG